MAVRPIDAVHVLNDINWHHKPTPVSEFESGFNQGINQAMWIITHAPTLTPPNEWVSVEDRLPDSQADVLVVAFWHENWQTMIGWHSDTGKKWRVITPHGEMEPGGVTHWRPLPAPPGEENDVPTNKPLTLEQLRQMDGEPVYIPEIECWVLVKREQNTFLFTFSDGRQCPASEWYEQVGPVYRRPPEGES